MAGDTIDILSTLTSKVGQSKVIEIAPKEGEERISPVHSTAWCHSSQLNQLLPKRRGAA